MASRRARVSTRAPSSRRSDRMSPRVRSCPGRAASRESVSRGACRASSTSSGCRPVSRHRSDSRGLCPVSRSSRVWTCRRAKARSRRVRLTFTGPSSRRKRRISPAILGTAYVENATGWLRSKPRMAFISPMQPSWNRSSGSQPRPKNRRATLHTRALFSASSRSMAGLSPACACRRSRRSSSFMPPAGAGGASAG